jgi:hypothetical protein
MLLAFIILDFFWSVSAWIYDWSKLTTIPLYLWPFVAVCPIYPLLLALVLLQFYLKKTPNQFLLAIAAVPSAVFGILAILFYPLAMIYQGFSWNAIGQIFWVLVYSSQGFYLLSKYEISKRAFFLGSTFTMLVILFHYFSSSFSYFDLTNIPTAILIWIIALAGFSIFFLYVKRRID